MHKIPIIAHRGASGYQPENTMAAFRNAIELKADAIELDVQVCKSGEIVVFHDKKLKRMTGAKGKLRKKKLAELRQLNIGHNEFIPTLKEVLDLCDAGININIELKSRHTATSTATIIRNSIRTGHWKNDNFFVSSFYFRELRRFHEIFPEIPIGLLYNKRPKKLKRRAKLLSPFAVHLNVKHIKKEWIALVHDLELKAFIWTVDDPGVATILASQGADGFFSNYPDRLIKQRPNFKI